MSLTIFENKYKLAYAAAVYIARTALQCINERGRFTIALSGGSTPKPIYDLLTKEPFKEEIPWNKVHVFWGDERHVPFEDEQNNARAAYEELLENVPVPNVQIHRISTAHAPEEEAKNYEALLKEYFHDGPPYMDLTLLGVGSDGHTASLFPGAPVLHEKKRWVKEVWIESLHMYRITLTAKFINQSRHILFLVSGKEKREILNTILAGSYRPDKVPAQLIKPEVGDLEWYVEKSTITDEAAVATKLNE